MHACKRPEFDSELLGCAGTFQKAGGGLISCRLPHKHARAHDWPLAIQCERPFEFCAMLRTVGCLQAKQLKAST
eukprot:scaffold33813_cov15-Tisochrysis_lutea.AAC.3